MPRKLDGVLSLDKPVGPSSSAALQTVKKLLGAKKAGHAGTLDPLASGLLPLLFGEATKFAQFGLDADKEYRAVVKLGSTTDTGDAEGRVLEQRPVSVDDAAVARALERFRGAIEQVPPMYSALKHAGQPLYALARRGESIERAAREIRIHELELLARAEDELELRIRCSKGTYVRQLAADIGAALGTGGHLKSLRRTAVGALRVEDSVTLEKLQGASRDMLHAFLAPIDSLLEGLPRLGLEAPQADRFLYGVAVTVEGTAQGPCRVYGPAGTLLGVGQFEAGRLQPRRLIARG